MTARNILMSAAGGSVDANYIEDVFSTWLYTGTGATQPINNGIDLAGKGGLVWTKNRTGDSTAHALIDTARGIGRILNSNNTGAQSSVTTDTTAALTTFNANGYTLGSDSGNWGTNLNSSYTYASWTFRKQPKFFDIVTYTGNGASTRNIPHNLGSVPGCVMVKRTNGSADWFVYHKDITRTQILRLSSTTAATNIATNFWGVQTATDFVVGSGGSGFYNVSGETYVVYLFADNAGGFGLTGTDNVITCGSYTTNSSAIGSVTLGWEPQWLLIKNASGSGNWIIIDNMRGFLAPGGANSANLAPNNSDSEQTVGIRVNATGFTDPGVLVVSGTVIYVAIRRGPMKVPTVGTSVFTPIATTFSTGTSRTVGFPADLLIASGTSADFDLNRVAQDRLRGFLNTNSTTNAAILYTNLTNAEANSGVPPFAYNVWNRTALDGGYMSGAPGVEWFFGRAPRFFDVVCYTGNGPGTQVVNHNLTVVPELVINKVRSTSSGWTVFQGSTTSLTGFLRLNDVNGQGGDTLNVSSTTITVDSTIGFGMNTSGQTYVTYLFATCPGVSKVGRYTGTGTTQVINCGFTGGARFVLIKSTSTSGDWYVWDSARGIVAGNDPYLTLNTTGPEVTSTDWIDPAATGFELSNVSGNLVNTNGVSYIFLAIA